MKFCPVEECEFCWDFLTCYEIASVTGEPIDLWETNCGQGDLCYLNCEWRKEKELETNSEKV